jgi:hypothetical protein
MRSRYFSIAPVSSSITALMKCSDAFAAEGSSLCWSRFTAKAYPRWQEGAFVVGGGNWASVRTCSAMTQLIMCMVRVWRRVRTVMVDGTACVRGERRRRVGSNDSLSESSSMMAGRSRQLGGALAGDLLPVSRVGCWTSSGFQNTTGSSSSMMGCGAVTGGGVGAVGGTLPRRSVCRAWIAASSSGGASCTPSIAVVRRAVALRILSVAVILGTGMVWWLNLKVSVVRSPPVSAIKTRMQR